MLLYKLYHVAKGRILHETLKKKWKGNQTVEWESLS